MKTELETVKIQNNINEGYEDLASQSLITGIHSWLGSGKSLLARIFAERYYNMGYEIESTMMIKGIPYRQVDYDAVLEQALLGRDIGKPTCWIFDQIETILDARRSLDTGHMVFSYFIYQCRKRDNRMVYTSTTSYTNDWRLGSETSYSIAAQKRHDSDESKCYNAKCKLVHYFYYRVIDNVQNRVVDEFEISAEQAKPYFQLYDSYELYSPAQSMNKAALIRTMRNLGWDEGKISSVLKNFKRRERIERPLPEGVARCEIHGIQYKIELGCSKCKLNDAS